LFEVRAKFKEDSGDAEGAIQDYKTSLHYRNDAYNIYNQIALNYFRLKQFEKALLAFNTLGALKEAERLGNLQASQILRQFFS
jgi:tetratricopeptide (TPR) repeat protein